MEYKKWKRVLFIKGLISNVAESEQYFEGYVNEAIVVGEQLFLKLDDKNMINVNYIVKIFKIKFDEDGEEK